MCSLGFNRDFVDLVSRIFEMSSSRLLVNGRLSTPFRIGRSVRQGDPLSMHLFVIYLHPLLQRIERVCGQDLVVAYADDISILVKTREQIERINELFNNFGPVSGAKLNLAKTVAIDVGYINNDPINVSWLYTTNTIKILGVYFANSIRVMIRKNWDTVVSKVAQHLWLHSMRLLTLHQKVYLLNTYINSKIWFLSSIVPPNSYHMAKVTATSGSFLWRGYSARVPIQQLARPVEKGGLNFHLPMMKAKSLLVNRHILELDSMPFYKSLLADRIRPIPTSLPDVAIVSQAMQDLPRNIQQNSSARLIYDHLLSLTDQPKVERNNPTIEWSKIWRNIACRKLSYKQRAKLYILANEKSECRKLLFVLRRADDESCTHCGAQVESLCHKYSECSRLNDAFNVLQQKLNEVINFRKLWTFQELLQPVLPNMNKQKKTNILKYLSNYVSFIDQCDDRIDSQSCDVKM